MPQCKIALAVRISLMLCFSTDMSWIPKRALGRIDRKKLDIFRKHATTLKIKPTSNDLTTLNIIGMIMDSYKNKLYM